METLKLQTQNIGVEESASSNSVQHPNAVTWDFHPFLRKFARIIVDYPQSTLYSDWKLTKHFELRDYQYVGRTLHQAEQRYISKPWDHISIYEAISEFICLITGKDSVKISGDITLMFTRAAANPTELLSSYVPLVAKYNDMILDCDSEENRMIYYLFSEYRDFAYELIKDASFVESSQSDYDSFRSTFVLNQYDFDELVLSEQVIVFLILFAIAQMTRVYEILTAGTDASVNLAIKNRRQSIKAIIGDFYGR